MILLYIINKEEVLAHKEEILSLVDEERRGKALSYSNEDDVLRSLGVGYLYMKILGKKPLFDAKGHPFYEEGPYISLAHSGSYSLLGVSDFPLGVDIEEIKKFPKKSKRFFPQYKDDLPYYEAWCRYEALAKCLGLGLSFSLNSPLPLGEVYEYEGKTYFLKTQVYDNHMIALASLIKEESVLEVVHP